MKRKRVEAAAELLRDKAGGDIECAIVLGSGFGAVLRDRIDGTRSRTRRSTACRCPASPGTPAKRTSACCTAGASSRSAGASTSTKAARPTT